MSERVTLDDFNSIPARAAVSEPYFDLGSILEALATFVRRYVVLSAAQALAVALFIVHTHVVDAADATPYLSVTSAEKKSGKSRLLEVLALLVHRPLRAVDITVAALFRSIGETNLPTVLMDEVDAIFGPKARGDREDLRAMLNAGFQRGTPVLRCVGEGSKTRVDEFHVFCPKALAGIGTLPDTVADRAIPIRLKRRTRSEQVERFRRREALALAATLRESIAAWATDHVDALAEVHPAMPDELDDRAQDAVEPLLTIADLACDNWPQRARDALISLMAAERADDSIGVQLLRDIRVIFDAHDDDRTSTVDLIEALADNEAGPWADWRGKGPLRPSALAQLLKPFDIKPRTIRLRDGSTPKGYLREQFTDAFERYLPHSSATTPQTASLSENETIPDRHNTTRVADRKAAANPHQQTDVAAVAAAMEHSGLERGINVPHPGDDGYRDLLNWKHAIGDLTDSARHELRLVDDQVRHAQPPSGEAEVLAEIDALIDEGILIEPNPNGPR